jgi:hypothetical protein
MQQDTKFVQKPLNAILASFQLKVIDLFHELWGGLQKMSQRSCPLRACTFEIGADACPK